VRGQRVEFNYERLRENCYVGCGEDDCLAKQDRELNIIEKFEAISSCINRHNQNA